MNVSLNNVGFIPLSVYEARARLNDQFRLEARITNAVSVLYYPVQHGGPMAHSELEIEGLCYSIEVDKHPSQGMSYDKRVCSFRRAYKEEKCGFVRFGITVTPKQLNAIYANIDSISATQGATCMHAVARVLQKYTCCSIPFPINLSPTASAFMMLIAKRFMGARQINTIDSHFLGKENALKIGLSITLEVAGTLLMVNWLCILVFREMGGGS